MQFDLLYKKLNREQRLAVDTIEGPVMVVAGPGTGKTQILTLRIANILRQTDIPPSAILAITFTEAGVVAMRERLVEIMGQRGYEVGIFTFHGFCNEVIAQYPEYFPSIVGSTNISQSRQYQLIEDILDANEWELLKPYGNPYYYVPSILGAISDLKREYVSPGGLRKDTTSRREGIEGADDLCHEKGAHKGKMKSDYAKKLRSLDKLDELAVVYEQYEEALREEKLFDFDDMIVEVVKVLESDEDFRLMLQEEYQYILADEHQDANGAQNQLLEHLSSFHEQPNLFIVGDEKQAIYRFQGASLENFLYFKKRFPEAVLIELTQNYRSSQTILDASHALITTNTKNQWRVPLTKGSEREEKTITVYSCKDHEDEYAAISLDIRSRIDAGVDPSEIAVLYRNNHHVELIARALSVSKIPYIIESKQDVFSTPEVKALLTLMRAVVNYGDEELLAQLLHMNFLRLEVLEVFGVLEESRTSRKKLYTLIDSRESLKELSKRLKDWHKYTKEHTALDSFSELFESSGLRSWVLAKDDARDAIESIRAVFSLLQEESAAQPGLMLSEFLEKLDTIEEYKLAGKKASVAPEDRVRLMTAHGSKGREFDVVYIAHATEGVWSNKRSRRLFDLRESTFSFDAGDDDRRLFYVALTRARKEVVLTHAQMGVDGREVLPSRFLGDVEDAHIELREFVSREEFSLLASPTTSSTPQEVKEYFKALFDRYGLSATALNNYLSCPWRYVYNNLLRMPQAQAKHLLYGTAIHAALKDLFDAQREGRDVSKDDLKKSFNFHLSKQPLVEQDYRELSKRGQQALEGYFDMYRGDWHKRVETEFSIRGVEIEGVKLSGSLDKVEVLEDGRSVHVVDYKTGKPKSRNVIEGNTKDSDGGLKRQLVFYNLLLDEYQDGKYQMVSAELDFIEPTESGKYKKERFEISDEEKKELRETIARVAKEIREARFWNETCDDGECQYCEMASLIKQESLAG